MLVRCVDGLYAEIKPESKPNYKNLWNGTCYKVSKLGRDENNSLFIKISGENEWYNANDFRF